MGSWQYDETDFERLSLIMMLYGLDFTVEEIKKYMKLSLEKNERVVLVVVKKQPLKRKQNTNRFKRSQFKIISYLFLLVWEYSKYCQGNTKINQFRHL